MDKLRCLLDLLGYRKSKGSYRHPERQMLFLGDYIDRGPEIRAVLETVRKMVEDGSATALMGNHEMNALHYHARGPSGQPLRAHTKEKISQHAATLEQFSTRPREWRGWTEWLSRLPLQFETDTFRAIHACWSHRWLKEIEGQSFADRDFLLASATPSTPVHRALETLLKGPEIALPEGVTILDKDHTPRKTMRVRWWGLQAGPHLLRSLVMPPDSMDVLGTLDSESLREIPDYPPNEKPVFCGHYWLRYKGEISPLSENVVCLDYSAGKAGPLVACRWNGSIQSSEFVATPCDSDPS